MRGHSMLGVVAAMAMMSAGAAVVPAEEPRRPRRKPDPSPVTEDEANWAAEDALRVEPEPREPYVMPEGMPNRLSVSYNSPHFHGGISSMIGVEIDGVTVSNCYEYNIPEGWYRVKQGSSVSDKMHSRDIRPFWKQQPSRQVLKRLRRG